MKVKINHFNLIEIVLTVAVIAFGVVVILGMLPKGLRAARNAGSIPSITTTPNAITATVRTISIKLK